MHLNALIQFTFRCIFVLYFGSSNVHFAIVDGITFSAVNNANEMKQKVSA